MKNFSSTPIHLMTIAPSVTWICMPWQSVNCGSLGLSLLKSILEEAACKVEIRYLNLSFADQIGQDLYQKFQYSSHAGELVFTPAAFYLEGDTLESWLAASTRVVKQETGVDEETFRHLVLYHVPKYLERCLATISWSQNQVIGFCLVYDQNLPSIALANRVKHLYPDLPILIGGASAFGTMGTQLVNDFPSIDVAVLGEAERVIVPIVHALAQKRAPERIPGISYGKKTDKERLVVTTSRPPKTDLDALPLPNFDDYFGQRRSFAFEGDPWGSFESSRGCWWGERSTCSFCGLNGEAIIYRVKSPQQVVAEVRQLREKYGVRFLSATDNILPVNALESLIPALSEVAREFPDIELFYQMKSNITRKHAHLMRQAGIRMVQPGIESFSDHILKLMAKGASAITQIQCLKLLSEERFQIIYGILHGSFGETASDYESQRSLIPWIKHLSPPSYFVKISLDRFSPYQETPQKYGIQDLKAAGPVELIYPTSKVDHDKLARSFHFTYVNPQGVEADKALQEAIECLRMEVKAWQDNYVPDSLVYFRTSSQSIHVRDRRSGEEQWTVLSEVEQKIFLRCEEACLYNNLINDSDCFNEDDVKEALEGLMQRRFLLSHEKWLLTLPLRRTSKKIIGLTGKSCVGKTTLLEMFQQQGYNIFDVGSVLIETLGFENYILPPETKLKQFGQGESIFHFLAPYLRARLEDCDTIVVDSLKASNDLEVLRTLFPDMCIELVLVYAPENVRQSRFTRRNRPGDESTLTEKDQKIKDIGISNVMKDATFIIQNNGTYEELCTQFQLLQDKLTTQWAKLEEF